MTITNVNHSIQALLLILLALILVLLPSQSHAADASLAPAEKSQQGKNLDAQLNTIKKQHNTAEQLEAHSARSEGLARKIHDTRLAEARVTLIKNGLTFVDSVLKQKDDGQALAQYREKITTLLASHPELVKKIQSNIHSHTQIPEPGLSAAEEAAAYQHVFSNSAKLDRLYQLSIQSLEFSRKIGMDISAHEAELKRAITDRAANIAVLLALASEDVSGFQAGVAVLPDDIELKAHLNLAKGRIQNIASALNKTVAIMKKLGLETSSYQQLSIATTGQITAKALEGGVMKRLALGWGEKIARLAIDNGPDFILKLLIFILIIVVTKKLTKVGKRIMDIIIKRSDTKLSLLLRRMLISVTGNIILILGILIALSQVGISLGPLLAGLGVAGFVIGFALQDVLSNFASGMMILIYRPFDVGDLVDAGGVFGKVNQMSLVNTTILTLDNQTIIIPNNKIWGDVIKNVTAQRTRRVDLTFSIAYDDDIPTTERVLTELVDADQRILDDPEPIVRLHELGDSSVNFVMRAWVSTEDYWDVYWDMTRTVKMRFDEEGISIPFPQRDMHLNTSQPLSIRIEGA